MWSVFGDSRCHSMSSVSSRPRSCSHWAKGCYPEETLANCSAPPRGCVDRVQSRSEAHAPGERAEPPGGPPLTSHKERRCVEASILVVAISSQGQEAPPSVAGLVTEARALEGLLPPAWRLFVFQLRIRPTPAQVFLYDKE